MPERIDHIPGVKKQLAEQFINEMNEHNYKRLNDFCLKEETTCFIMKSNKRFVMFPNDYTYEDHDFKDEKGKFIHLDSSDVKND
jgi:phage FluMu protein Com